MSAANVELVRSIYENFGRGDVPAVLGALDPNVEWVENDQPFLPWHGTHRSPAAVAQHVFGGVQEHFDEFAVVPVMFHDAGDIVVVEGRAKGRTKQGRTVDAPACWVWTVRNGKATRNVNYHDTDAWRVSLQRA
jgi:ketosteroid isomerase-like protein